MADRVRGMRGSRKPASNQILPIPASMHYADNMNSLREQLANKLALRNNIIRSILFYFPDTRTDFARQLGLAEYNNPAGNPNYRLTPADISDEAMIQAIFQDPAAVLAVYVIKSITIPLGAEQNPEKRTLIKKASYCRIKTTMGGIFNGKTLRPHNN